jgi:hypothetical protein
MQRIWHKAPILQEVYFPPHSVRVQVEIFLIQKRKNAPAVPVLPFVPVMFVRIASGAK